MNDDTSEAAVNPPPRRPLTPSAGTLPAGGRPDESSQPAQPGSGSSVGDEGSSVDDQDRSSVGDEDRPLVGDEDRHGWVKRHKVATAVGGSALSIILLLLTIGSVSASSSGDADRASSGSGLGGDVNGDRVTGDKAIAARAATAKAAAETAATDQAAAAKAAKEKTAADKAAATAARKEAAARAAATRKAAAATAEKTAAATRTAAATAKAAAAKRDAAAKRATAKAATAKRSAARAAAALAAEQKRLAGPAGYTCTKLAEQAVMVSDGTGQGRKLVKVRATRAVTDNRSTYRPPSGTGEALVLSCRGTGIWSAGTASPVLLTLTVDAASDAFVSYREL